MSDIVKVQEKQKLVEQMAGLQVAPRSYRGVGNGKGWRPQTTEEREARFWSQVQIMPSGCWEWQGGKISNRHGSFSLKQKRGYLAHRASWEFTFGPIENGLSCLHKCDNGICVRPDHLFLARNWTTWRT